MALPKTYVDELKKVLVRIYLHTQCTLADVSDVFRKAKKEAQTRKGEREALYVSLWDKQVETLSHIDCPQSVLDQIVKKKDETIRTAIGMDIPDHHIPFLIVVPKQQWGFDAQMKTLVYKGNKGCAYFDVGDINNIVSTPSEPYAIFDVEDGTVYRGYSPRKAEEAMQKDNRLPLVVEECIALALHTNVLSDHYLDCTGSRYLGGVPHVCLHGDELPGLYWSDFEDGGDGWGSPSCRGRH